ncbi:unnamed protein product [Leuciscus chuanchicus]
MFQKLPRVLRQRTTAQYKWHWDKKNIVDIVSGQLRKDIMAEICSNLLNKGMFLSLNKEFTEAILMKLDKECFNAGDIIIHQNAQPDSMFFIDCGRVLVRNEAFQEELCDGDYFGEIIFLFGGRQSATVSALTTCSLFTLSLREFQEIEEEFPHVVNELRGAVQQHQNDLESSAPAHLCPVALMAPVENTSGVNSASVRNNSSSPNWPALAQGIRRARNPGRWPRVSPDQAPELTVETRLALARTSMARPWPDSGNAAIVLLEGEPSAQSEVQSTLEKVFFQDIPVLGRIHLSLDCQSSCPCS